jgi:cell division septal protein FtsQ
MFVNEEEEFKLDALETISVTSEKELDKVTLIDEKSIKSPSVNNTNLEKEIIEEKIE